MARQVAVCGPNECTDTEAGWAHEVGARLAEAGVVVLTGGGGGVMAAAAAGARAGGGIVVGIRPDAGPAPGSTDGADLTVVLRTDLGQARNAVLVGSADAVIAIGGSWGTLSEVALARRLDRPTFWLGGWRLADPDGSGGPGVVTVDSVTAAVAAALAPDGR